MSPAAKWSAGAAATVIFLIILLVVLLIGRGTTDGETRQLVAGPSALRAQAVPAWARAPLAAAAQACPALPTPVLAAQLETESGWNPDAHNSDSGADGLAQFLPSTWAEWGRDGDHDGTANPRDPDDAIAAQAAYMCHLVDLVRTNRELHGEILDLALAAYNAGPGNITKYRGIPPYSETVNYVRKIRQLATTTYAQPQPPPPGPTGPAGSAVAAARRYLGKPYAWGGGTLNGPSPGIAPDIGVVGFDCSGLTRFAIHQGSNGHITLPRTSQSQYDATKATPVPLDQLLPGDLLFWGGPSTVHHVALYTGNGTMIEAPESGTTIRETKVRERARGDFLGATRAIT